MLKGSIKKEHMQKGKIKKTILMAFCGIAIVCFIMYAALVVVLQSSAVLNYLASAFGYEISAGAVSFSPGFSGKIEGLRIQDAKSGLTVICPDVEVKHLLTLLLEGRIDSLVLRNPRLTIRSDTPKGGKPDLSFLEKLPTVRLLDIQNADVDYLSSDARELKLTDCNIKITDFSPGSGGGISLRSTFSYTSDADTRVSLRGRVVALLRLTGLYPKPYGKGSIDLTLDSGEYGAGGKTVSLHESSLAATITYDRDTETVTLGRLDAKGGEIGTVKASASASMTGSMPWQLSVAISSLDIAKVFGTLRAFLPYDVRGWAIKGRGGIETVLHGVYADKKLSFSGPATISFKDAGASSPDNSITAQGYSGMVAIKMDYTALDRKLAINIQAATKHGELLWNNYYNDFKGQKTSVTADGVLYATRNVPFTANANIDLFQTGQYSVSMSGNKYDWSVNASADHVSHQSVIARVLKEYLDGSTSGLKGLSATGFSSLETSIRRLGEVTYISGVYKMADTAVNVPDLELSVRTVSVELPFDFVYPSHARRKPASSAAGSIHFTGIQRERLNIENIYIPVIIAQNRLEVPQRVVIPFYAGKIHFYDVMVDDLLSPDKQVRFGLQIENINLGRLTQRFLKQELPGRINADFGVMTYQNRGLRSGGSAKIDVFDGEITATNFFAQDITLPSRRFGGDVTMKDINLEKMTAKIAIGRMSGVIQGSLKNFVMEYGQPSSFVMDIESVKKRGIDQTISADAIDNISILSTGVGGILSHGITKYFKDFPYSRIGFRCALKNDQFMVNGTVIEGNKEYLVRRGLFQGVDVINQNRNNTISFHDMEERLKRISKREKARTGEMPVP